MEQPVTGSYQAKVLWGGEIHHDDHGDNLCWVAFSLQSTLVLCCQPLALAPYRVLTELDYVPSLRLWASTVPAEWAAGPKLSTPATADWIRMGPSPKESDQILSWAKLEFKWSPIKTTFISSDHLTRSPWQREEIEDQRG